MTRRGAARRFWAWRPPPVWAAAVALLALAAAGCRSGGDIVMPATDQQAFQPDREALFQLLRQRDAAIRSLNLELAADYREGERRERATLLVIAQKPENLYAELTGPLGALGMMSADGDQTRVWDAGQGRLSVGPASQTLEALPLPIALTPRDLTGLLTAAPPPMAHDAATVEFDRALGRWRLALVERESRTVQSYWFDFPSGDLVRMQLTRRGEALGRVSYLRWRDDVAGARLPELWKIEFPRRRVVLRLERKGAVMLNETYPPKTFRIEAPR